MSTRVGKQREVMEKAFHELGGTKTLIEWANFVDKHGDKPNYKEFIKLYVKLVPPIKSDTVRSKDTQEGFIMQLVKEQNILQLQEGKPTEIIEI